MARLLLGAMVCLPMAIPQLGDQTPITAGEIDWTLFDPGRVDHVRQLLAFPLERGTLTHDNVAGLLVMFRDKRALSLPKAGRRQVVDMGPAIEAKGRVAGAEEARADARDHYRSAVRSVYRAGATAPALAEALGVSVGRVHQLVAGGRSSH